MSAAESAPLPAQPLRSMESRVSQAPSRTVVVLAAGEGKRMKSATPKMLHPLLGRTLLGHVLHAAEAARRRPHRRGRRAQGRPGHARTSPRSPRAPPRSCRPSRTAPGTPSGSPSTPFPRPSGTVVVLNGDVPLLRPETVEALVAAHESSQPGRDRARRRGARPDRPGADRARRRRQPGAHRRGARRLPRGAGDPGDQRGHLRVRRRAAAGGAGQAVHRQRPGRGVPDRRVRAARRRRARRSGCTWPPTRWRRWAATTGPSWRGCGRCCATGSTPAWMRAGVSILDPATTWIDVTVRLEPDARGRPEHRSCGVRRRSAAGAVVGPDTTLIDTVVGAGRDGAADACDRRADRPGRHGRPVLVPAAGHAAGPQGEGRRVRRDEERRAGRGCEGAAPDVRGRRDDRRAGQHRRGHDLRQLRRGRTSTTPPSGRPRSWAATPC